MTLKYLLSRVQVALVRKRGPNKTRFKDGSATTIVSYFPQVDVDGTTYVDDEGEGLGDLIDDSDEEEAEEEEEEGKSLHRGGNDSEEDNGGEDSQNSNEIN